MYHLNGTGGDFTISSEAWPLLLALAEQHGWQPEGTRPNKEFWRQEYESLGIAEAERLADEKAEAWRGSYTLSEHQTVTAGDAKALAAALRRGLDAIPEDLERSFVLSLVKFIKAGSFQIW